MLHLYTRTCHVTSWVGWGGDVNVRCTCTHAHATSRLGLGGVGMLTYVALVHTHMPRHVLGWVGWGGDVNVRCTCTHAHATSRLGLGRVGAVSFCWHHTYKMFCILLHFFLLHDQSAVILTVRLMLSCEQLH